MVLREETIGLQHPGIQALPRIGEQTSFLYLSEAKISQNATGVIAYLKEGETGRRVSLPTASLASLQLGPGTSITQAALTTIARHGTVVSWVGADSTRTHGWAYSLTSSARWVEAQAALWADPTTRTQVAVQMYEQRFGGLPPGGTLTLNRLRGLEGQRMRKLYSALAKKHRVTFKRDYNPDRFDDSDGVNQALSAANAAIYGVCLAAITALGCHPGLGFVHAGNISSFVHDIADLYKAETSIPAAFSASKEVNPGAEARRRTREAIVRERIMTRAVTDIQKLLAPGLKAASPNEQVLRTETGFVPGATNYALDVPPASIWDTPNQPTPDDEHDDEWETFDPWQQ